MPYSMRLIYIMQVLKNQYLTDAQFIDSNLARASLNGSDLSGADFTRANLTGEFFYDAKNIKSAIFTDTQI